MSKSDESRAGDSSPALVIHKSGDLYSAATQVGIAFFQYSLPAAQVWLIENGFDAGLLDSPADALVWRSTITAAFASELESIDLRLDQVASTADVEAIKSRQEIISENLAALSAGVRAEQRRREIEAGEIELNRRAEATFAQVGGRDNPVTIAAVWSTLRNSPLGRRIKELRQQ